MFMKLNAKNRFFLAPMAGMNDIAFRILCKKAGAGLVYTGMMSPLSRKEENLEDKPAIQIFCTSTRGLESFIERHDTAALFDLNLGCPAYTAQKQGFGSYLNDTKAIEKILQTMVDTTKKPITLKIRKSVIYPELLRLAEKYCSAIAVHPRTNRQGYSGKPDMDFAVRVKKETSLPVIYSGNVNEGNATELLERFDFLMIGRGALGDPGVFSRLLGRKSGVCFIDYLELARKYGLTTTQIKIHALHFTKGMKGAKTLRLAIAKCRTTEEIERFMS
ncbi:MAG: tRNA-dihydrouridine synthase [Candidatus Aenigmatarchaeota archaeon]